MVPANRKSLFFVETPADLEIIRQDILSAHRVAYDAETDGDPNYSTVRVSGFSLVTDSIKTYFPIEHPGSRCIDPEVAWSFLDEVVHTVPEVWMHNAVFDMKLALRVGVEFPDQCIRDTILAAYLLNEPQLALKTLVAKHLGINSPTYTDVTQGWPTTKLPAALVGPYCMADSYITLQLGDYLVPLLQADGSYSAWLDTECPFSAVIAHMESVGFRLDTAFLTPYRDALRESLRKVESSIYEYTGRMNLNSNDQFEIVFAKGIWDSRHKQYTKSEKKKQLSVTSEWLKWMVENTDGASAELASLLLEYRKLEKLSTTYTDSLLQAAEMHPDGRIRCNFNQTRTHTGRLSSSKPNLQNIPSRSDEGQQIRKAFIPSDGFVISDTDLSQVELRVMAHFAQDRTMLSVYHQGCDLNGKPMKDLHYLMADTVVERYHVECSRKEAKAINFGYGYGMGAEKFARTRLGGVTPEKLHLAKMSRAAFFEMYADLKPLHKRLLDFYARYGYIRLLNGQKIHFDRTQEHYADVLNAPIQGSAALAMKHALINIMRVFKATGWWNTKARIVSTVHDEAIVEIHTSVAELANQYIRGCFEQTTVQLGSTVPLLATPVLGPNWLDAHGD